MQEQGKIRDALDVMKGSRADVVKSQDERDLLQAELLVSCEMRFVMSRGAFPHPEAESNAFFPPD